MNSKIGPFSILPEGKRSGANATVVFGTDDNGVAVAIKYVRKSQRDGERYKRFLQELELNKKLRGRSGVLPFLESGEDPSRVWFAMPRAMEVREALGAGETDRCIACTARYAHSLAKLQANGIYHRDIKPANLFFLDEDWVIGDFGIAKFPSAENLTEAGQKLGPVY